MIVPARRSIVAYWARARNTGAGAAFVSWIAANASADRSDRYGQTAIAPTPAPSVFSAARREKVIGCAAFGWGAVMRGTLDQPAANCKRGRRPQPTPIARARKTP